MLRNLWKRRPSSPDSPEASSAPDGAALSPVPQAAPGPTPPAGPSARAKLFSFDPLGTTVVVTIVERHLTSDRTADLLYHLRELLAQHTEIRNLVLDLQNVDYLDSACLNMLVVLLKAVRDAGGNISIASAKRSIEVLFKLTRLDSLFPIQRDVLAAIAFVERAAA